MPRALAGGLPHPCGVCFARAAQRRTRDDATRRQADGLSRDYCRHSGTDRPAGAALFTATVPLCHCATVQGGADVFKLGYFGKDAFLAQSPQLCAAHSSPHAARCMLHVACRTLQPWAHTRFPHIPRSCARLSPHALRARLCRDR